MTAQAPTYDLVLLLDPEVEEPARGRPLADARAAIESQGELLRHDDWGSRAMTYPINHRAAAEYHLLQFHAGNPELLRSLDRSLRIADEVLRFRIVKLRPGTPDPPDMRASAAAAVAPPPRRGAPTGQSAPPEQASSPAEPAPEPAPVQQAAEPAAAEQAAEPVPVPQAAEPVPAQQAAEAEAASQPGSGDAGDAGA
jgi:small subunit ribosomal protein S6